MKKILFSAAMALVLVSCSRDEVIEVNRDSDVIEFGVVTNASTRAADVYCNNNMPGEFTVYADYDGKPYIDADVIQHQSNKWVNTSGVRYWPEGDVSFYAHVNSDGKFTGTDFTATPNVAPQIKGYTVPTTVADQKDLLYAVKSQSQTEGQVTLNFRHALSQIVFQAKNTNENLYVEIDGVTICNLGNTNTFTYPTADTDDNIINHGGVEGTITYNDSWGTWAVLNGGNTDYPVTFTAVPVPGDGAVKSLTNTNDTDKEFSSNAMLLLPQTTTAWDTTTKPSAETQTGSYFLVDCKICNVAGDAYASTDIVLWDGSVAIPASFTWEQGNKYIYTFVFGDGNGGYDPNPDTPDPVLVPITFNVTVDDFVPVTQPETPMETK